MTLLYRLDTPDSPDRGSGTFWSMHEGDTTWLAEWEGRSPSGCKLYRTEVIFEGTELGEVSVDRLHALHHGSFKPDDLVTWVGHRASPSQRWVQFTTTKGNVTDPWYGAVLYMGDEQLAAELVT